MKSGWIKLYRKLLDNRVANDPVVAWCWVRFLLEASHNSKEYYLGNQKVSLEPGQFVWGEKAWGKILNVSNSTARRIKNKLIFEGLVEEQTTNKFTVITVIKWNEYQECEEHVKNKNPKSEEQMKNKTQKNEEQKVVKTSVKIEQNKIEESQSEEQKVASVIKNRRTKTQNVKTPKEVNTKKIKNSYSNYTPLPPENSDVGVVVDEVEEVHLHYCDVFKTTPARYKLTSARKIKIKLRIKEFSDNGKNGVDVLKTAIDHAAADGFYSGDNDRNWTADLDYIVRSYEKTEKLFNLNPRRGKQNGRPNIVYAGDTI